MRILNCYVKNFGTLSNFNLNFEKGLTVIKEDNGFGKSTLAVFLKAMFYGFPKRSGHSIDTNERMKFAPWQGGIFGGRLDFEVEGRKYRVERTFGAREKEDTFKLLDLVSGGESEDYSSDLGVELFGMDAESFERSIYASQSGTATVMTDSLSAKLTGLLENGDGSDDFDLAIKLLDKREKFYNSPSKGELNKVNQRIEKLEKELRDMTVATDNLVVLEGELAESVQKLSTLKKALDETRQKISAVSSKEAREIEKVRYLELSEEIKRLEARFTEKAAKYPNGLPDDTEIAEAEKKYVALKEAKAKHQAVGETNTADIGEIEKLRDFFGGVIPTEEEIQTAREDVRELQRLDSEFKAFGRCDAEIEKIGKGKVLSKIGLVLGASAIISGIVTLNWSLIVGVALAVSGLVLLGVAAFGTLKNMITHSNNTVGIYGEKESAEFKAKAEKISNRLASFTEKYIPEESPVFAFETIDEAFKDYKRALAAVEKFKQRQNEYIAEIYSCKTALDGFFVKYGIDKSLEISTVLSDLRHDKTEIVKAKEDLQLKREQLSKLPVVQDDQPTHTAEDRQTLLQREAEIQSALDVLQKRKVSLEVEIGRLKTLTEARFEVQEELFDLGLNRNEMKENLEVLQLTSEYLKEAKQSLSTRYLDTVSERFRVYCRMFDVALGDILVDSELNVKLDVDGTSRQKSSFSRGVQDVLDIAMRLSLNEALFQKEQALLMLDDPFVNLDDTRLKKAIEILKEIAEDRQIVYLTCHSSRC